MSILMWDKPKQVMSRDEYEAISADGAPPGVYTPNMSKADTYKWRAKKIGGKNPRVEIRKSVFGTDPVGWADGTTRPHWQADKRCFAQLLIIVMPDGRVRMSQNGPAAYTDQDWTELSQAVTEAREALSGPA